LFSHPLPGACDGNNRRHPLNTTGVSIMGKYFLGWILGVPVVVLVIIYLIFN
jgi:hypothetical protein